MYTYLRVYFWRISYVNYIFRFNFDITMIVFEIQKIEYFTIVTVGCDVS